MLKYTLEEALLLAWKEKLETIKTDRAGLKSELLELLDRQAEPHLATRFQRFNQKRNELLDDNHNQGWSWTANFNWLWTFISFISFQFFNVNPQPGSRLRQALLEVPQINTELITITPVSTDETIPDLQDDEFEKALFSEPQKAFKVVQAQLETLNRASDSQEKMKAAERLEAIKLRLSPQDYRHYLTRLFELAPEDCFKYFYQLYCDDQHETPNLHEFIEHHLMARALVKLLVSPQLEITDQESPNPYLFAMQELILILSTISSKDDPIQGLVLSQSSLNSDARETAYKGVKGTILTQLEKKISSDIFKFRNYDSPLRVAEDFFHHITIKRHPLLTQVARLACEVFLHAYLTSTEDNKKKWSPMGYLTLELFAQKILDNWPVDFKFGSIISSNALLSPYPHHSGIQSDYQDPERYAVAILIQACFSKNDSLQLARQLCIEAQKRLTAPGIDWILNRIGTVHPDLRPKLELILKKTVFFDNNYLSLWSKSTFPTMQPDELIGDIEQCLATAQLNCNVDAEAENTANEKALSTLNYLLTHCKLSAGQLDIAFQFLLKFHNHCIKNELFTTWTAQIREIQCGLMRWTAEKAYLTDPQLELLKRDETIAAISKINKPFKIIEKMCIHAELAQTGLQANFSAAKNYSQVAVHVFSLFMSECASEPSARKKIPKALRYLKGSLQNYLSEEQYSLWYQKLLEYQQHSSAKTDVGFFETTLNNKPKDPETLQEMTDNPGMK